jgi:hypothetical protein
VHLVAPPPGERSIDSARFQHVPIHPHLISSNA